MSGRVVTEFVKGTEQSDAAGQCHVDCKNVSLNRLRIDVT